MKTEPALFVLSKRRHDGLETLVEFAGTAFGVDVALLAGIDGMGCGRSIQRKQRIFFAVCPNHRFSVCFGARTNQPAFIGTAVEKKNGPVIVRMNIRFHILPCLKCYNITNSSII